MVFNVGDKVHRNVLLSCDHGLMIVNRFDCNDNQVGHGQWLLDHGNTSTIEAFNCYESIKEFSEPVIFDIGANIGTFTTWMAKAFPQGKVYSFEPQKIVFDILQKNIELNNCKNIIPYNFGGSNVNNIFYMNACYDLKDNQGAFCIDKSLDETNGLKIQCRIIDELNIQNVGYIKIDVEGHEYEALLGMEKIISRDKPTIMIEIHDDCITKNDTFLFFEKIGYKKYYKISHCDYIFLNSKFEVFDKINNIY